MVFDVDQLKEALTSNDESAERDEVLEDAARLVAAGHPLWWCEEHEMAECADGEDRRICDHWDGSTLCRMVEGWWMPTGGGE